MFLLDLPPTPSPRRTMRTANLCLKPNGHGHCPQMALDEDHELVFCSCLCHMQGTSADRRTSLRSSWDV